MVSDFLGLTSTLTTSSIVNFIIFVWLRDQSIVLSVCCMTLFTDSFLIIGYVILSLSKVNIEMHKALGYLVVVTVHMLVFSVYVGFSESIVLLTLDP